MISLLVMGTDVALIVFGILGLSVAIAGLLARRMTLGASLFWLAYGGFCTTLGTWPQIITNSVLGLPRPEGTQLVVDWVAVVLVYLIYAILTSVLRIEATQSRIVRRLALVSESAPPRSPAPGRPPEAMAKVGVVIPARNEEGSIGAVLDRQCNEVSDVEMRTFVVDDGSTDRTAEIARRHGASVLTHASGLGIGAALSTGFEAAARWGAEFIVMMDADGQHPPEDIARLLAPLRAGKADIVLGSRFYSASPRNLSFVRRSGVRVYSRLLNALTPYHVTDVTSGFRAFRASCLGVVRFESPMNWAVEMTLRAGRAHLRYLEIPVQDPPRKSGRSQFHDLRQFFLYHFRVMQQIYRVYAPSAGPPVSVPVRAAVRIPVAAVAAAERQVSSAIGAVGRTQQPEARRL